MRALPQQPETPDWLHRAMVAGAIIAFVLLGALALSFDTLVLARDTVQIQVGDVAPRDISAPRSLVYNSDVLTEQARTDAIASVEPVYDPAPDVTRGQIQLASTITDYVGQVRQDTFAEPPRKITDMGYIEALTITEEIWSDVIALNDLRWEQIETDINSLVEETMRTDIRPDNIDTVRSNLVNSVATRYSDRESDVIVAITEDLIQPNTFFNQEQTSERQNEAAQNVTIQERRFEEGQLIVRSGNIVTALDVEALRQFGFLQQDELRFQAIFGSIVAMILVVVIMGVYFDYFYPAVLHNTRMLTLMGVLFLIFLMSVHLFAGQPYLFPVAALAILIINLVGAQTAIMVSSLLAILLGITQPPEQALQLAAFTFIGSVVAVLAMRRLEKLNGYFIAGAFIGLVNILVIVTFALTSDQTPSLVDTISNSFFGFINGFLAAVVALVALYFVTNALNLTTSLKLIELMDSKNPLLQRLLREAPGTYQHSLQVGNLSELAAEAIGANATLVRVAAMYHDIGKILNPFYFVENTAEGMNPHQDLDDPFQSAKVIIGHVIEGERIARRAKLPPKIRDFIMEHHGTTQVSYFYNQALERAEISGREVNIDNFTYPGPTPRTRETAIMMLADGVESATRAVRPSNKKEIEGVVNQIFEARLGDGQLDDSGLTLNDLKTIRQIFLETLQAMYHPRIAYKQSRSKRTTTQLTSGIVKNLEAAEPDVKVRKDGETIPEISVADPRESQSYPALKVEPDEEEKPSEDDSEDDSEKSDG